MNNLINLLLLSLIGSVFGLIGGIIFLYVPQLSKQLAKYSISFAAGILLTVALLGLLPEAAHALDHQAFTIVLLGFLLAFFFEHFCHLHHHHQECEASNSNSLIIFGDTIHNFIDGVSIAAAYLTSTNLGLILALSTFLHELPHEVGDFGVLLNSGWKKSKILLINFLSSLSTFAGALLTFYLIPTNQLTGTLIAIAAGIFLYLSASDFLPQISHHSKTKRKHTLTFLFAVLLMSLILTIIPHNH
jgi:zinc and cadmium transporter